MSGGEADASPPQVPHFEGPVVGPIKIHVCVCRMKTGSGSVNLYSGSADEANEVAWLVVFVHATDE